MGNHYAMSAPLPVTPLTDAPSATVSNWITNNATTGVITGNGSGTPNRLLFKGTL
jgi:hypothetical protein